MSIILLGREHGQLCEACHNIIVNELKDREGVDEDVNLTILNNAEVEQNTRMQACKRELHEAYENYQKSHWAWWQAQKEWGAARFKWKIHNQLNDVYLQKLSEMKHQVLV